MIKKGNKIRGDSVVTAKSVLLPIGLGAGGWAMYKQIKDLSKRSREEQQEGPSPSKYPTIPVPRAPTGVDLPSPKNTPI